MVWPFTKKAVIKQKRQFENGAAQRLNLSWATNSNSIDADLRTSLRSLRARSRDLAQNNDYARKFLSMVSTHVVGPNNFQLQVQGHDVVKSKKIIDVAGNAAIENAFYNWCQKGQCDITGKYSFFDICNLYIKAVARDGEVLIRKIYGKDVGDFSFQLQILDIDRLDVEKNEVLNNGVTIRMGVEYNQYSKPIAYWIRTSHPGDTPYYATKDGGIFERIPADDIYHHFIADRPEQTRGLPWMHTAMARLKMLQGYEEAAVVAARVGATKMGFFTSPDGDGAPLADETDEQGTLTQNAEPGRFDVLPAGYDFKTFDPDYPHAMFAEFIKSCLRGVASGIGVAYNTLANDLEGVNFSSIRSGTLEERDQWMVIQRWMIENFLNDVYSTWLKFALISNKIVFASGGVMPFSKYDKFNVFKWQGRRWQWVDPLKDVEANVVAINNGLRSREDVISETGRDIEDVFMQLSAENEQMKKLNINVVSNAQAGQMDAQGNPIQ